MIVRPYTEEDFEAVRRIHEASGLDYRLPDLSSPLFLSKMVAVRNGEVTTMLAGRIDVETYLITSGKPAEKLQDIEQLQQIFLSDLWSKGVDTAYCSVPPEVNKHFAKRMRRLGWEEQRGGWKNWYRETGGQ